MLFYFIYLLLFIYWGGGGGGGWLELVQRGFLFGKEGKGHSMQRDRTQKKRGNQQWRVWYKESEGREYQKQSEDSHR